MKRGHVVGTRKVTRKAQAWYDATQEKWRRKSKRTWPRSKRRTTAEGRVAASR